MNRHIFILLIIFLQGGCSGLISSATVNFTGDLSYSIMNHNDPATVEAAAPAYMLMIDSLLHRDPDNESLLCSAASLYSAYADIFVKDKIRSQKLTDKAMQYALHAVCVRKPSACLLRDIRFQEFENITSEIKPADIPAFYTLGVAWAGWIQSHKDDWNAVAEISRVEAIMQQVLQVNELYKDGEVHLYLGTLATLLPPAMGGKPDEGKKHFERAMEISGKKNLMIRVIYARQYARLIFDRELHDRLLQSVLNDDPNAPGYVLMNTLAQQQAKELLDSAGDYF